MSEWPCAKLYKKTQVPYLIKANIVDGKIEPKAVTGIARIWTNIEVVFKLTDVVNPTEIS